MDSQAPRYAPRRRTRSQGKAPALPLPVRRRAKSPCYGDKVRALCSEGQGGLLEWTRQLGVSSGGAIQNGYCLFISVNLVLGVTGRVARHNCGRAMNPDDAAREAQAAEELRRECYERLRHEKEENSEVWKFLHNQLMGAEAVTRGEMGDNAVAAEVIDDMMATSDYWPGMAEVVVVALLKKVRLVVVHSDLVDDKIKVRSVTVCATMLIMCLIMPANRHRRGWTLASARGDWLRSRCTM
eukprot:COSAG01_NODE_2326_length_7903_cov_22.624552_11_plen_240_part_00